MHDIGLTLLASFITTSLVVLIYVALQSYVR